MFFNNENYEKYYITNLNNLNYFNNEVKNE